MTSRREFLSLAAAAGITAPCVLRGATTATSPAASSPSPSTDFDRAGWAAMATRLAEPVLSALAARQLKQRMPVEAHQPTERAKYTHLEAMGRLLAGLAPWLERAESSNAAASDREGPARFAALARESIDAATDPQSPDYMNFTEGGQPLVDAAFLAQAFVRAPNALWEKLPTRVKDNVAAALTLTRRIKPPETNWVLFASLVEVALHRAGVPVDSERFGYGIRQHQRWYLGDGTYGDGPEYHWDYYNSYVIQPMLLDALEAGLPGEGNAPEMLARVRARLTRYAEVQERMIAPDGSYPVLGRSIAYRCGAFQVLALAAWRGLLPHAVSPAQARSALGAVIRRTLGAPDTFDEKGWLRIGLSGHQPALAEPYISTGSLYLSAAAFLPLGLEQTDPFWSGAPQPTTSQQIWLGKNLAADHALKES